MTAIQPLPTFRIDSESARARKTQQHCPEISVVSAADVTDNVTEQSNKDDEDAGFCGESFADNGELLASLSPLLFSMKLFGMYFERGDRHRQHSDDPEWKPARPEARTSSTWLRVYATVILIVVWLNFIRFVTVFNQYDRFSATLLMKITTFTWFGLMAIFQTTYYHASHTGQLLKILLTLPVTRDCIRGSRRVAIGLTVLMWITSMFNISVGSFIFAQSGEEYSFILAPFVTQINVSDDNINITRLFGFLCFMMIFPGVLFAHSMSQSLVYIFYTQFKKLKKNFRLTLGVKGRFDGDLSSFRRRHQVLSRAIRKVDGFMQFSNVAGFVCHIANIILLLYGRIFFPQSYVTFASSTTGNFWITGNVYCLLFSTSAGIMVNHMVSTYLSPRVANE